VKPSRRVQLFKSNWMRNLSAIVSDHLAPIRIWRPARHDQDFPGVLMGHDRDGEIRRQLQILQPDRGLQFFADFRWLLQSDSFTARTGPPPLAIRASACL